MLFRSEQGIGRGETPESQLEVPFFIAFTLLSGCIVLGFHLYFHQTSWTVALAASFLVFGLTFIRVEFGVFMLVLSMLLSPEISVGAVGAAAERTLNIRYEDILIVVVFAGVLLKLGFERDGTLWRVSPVNMGIAAYYTVCVLSTLLAYRLSLPAWDERSAFFVMLKMLEFYMVFVLVSRSIRTMNDVRYQLAAFFVVALVVAVYATYSIRLLDRVSAPFEQGGTEPNTLGGYLTIVMCVAAGLMVHAPTRAKRLLFLALVVVAFIPFLYTLSRASYFSFMVALAALGLRSKQFVFIALIAGVIVVSPFIMPEKVKARVNMTFEGEPVVIAGMDTGLTADKSTQERIYVWGKVRHTLRWAPWFGGGVSWETVLDSQYARVLIETGVIGFCAFLFLLYRILLTTHQAYMWSPDWVGKGLALGAFAATIGMIVHSLGTISFLIVRIMMPFWYVLGLTAVVRWRALLHHAAIAGAVTEPKRPAPAPPLEAASSRAAG